MRPGGQPESGRQADTWSNVLNAGTHAARPPTGQIVCDVRCTSTYRRRQIASPGRAQRRRQASSTRSRQRRSRSAMTGSAPALRARGGTVRSRLATTAVAGGLFNGAPASRSWCPARGDDPIPTAPLGSRWRNRPTTSPSSARTGSSTTTGIGSPSTRSRRPRRPGCRRTSAPAIPDCLRAGADCRPTLLNAASGGRLAISCCCSRGYRSTSNTPRPAACARPLSRGPERLDLGRSRASKPVRDLRAAGCARRPSTTGLPSSRRDPHVPHGAPARLHARRARDRVRDRCAADRGNGPDALGADRSARDHRHPADPGSGARSDHRLRAAQRPAALPGARRRRRGRALLR